MTNDLDLKLRISQGGAEETVGPMIINSVLKSDENADSFL